MRSMSVILVALLVACAPAAAPPPEGTTAPAVPGPMIVGVKVDQPGTGFLDVATYRYSGMDVEIGRAVSRRLLGPGQGESGEPYFLPVSSDTRVPYLKAGAVRYFVAT